MYLVWKQRKIRTSRPSEGCLHQEQAGRVSLVPILVRNRRVNGKSRQEHIATFPSIRTCCLGDSMIRARWWRRVEEILKRLQESGKVTDEVAQPGEPWSQRVRGILATKVTYPTLQEWAAFEAITERLRNERIAREAREAGEQLRREERQRQDLRRKMKEGTKLPEASNWQDFKKSLQKTMEETKQAMEQLNLSTQRMKEKRLGAQDKEEQRKNTAQGAMGGEAVSPTQESDKRQNSSKREVRLPREVRI